MKSPETGELPLEMRLEHRADAIRKDVLQISADLRQHGISERGLAGYVSCLEYMNEIIGSALAMAANKNREQFILEMQSAIRRLAHGLTTGEISKREAEQLQIAKNPGKLRSEIAEALIRATGSGESGPDETMLESEQKV